MFKTIFSNKRILKLLILSTFTPLIACISKKQIVENDIDKPATPTLIFLNYNLSKDAYNKKTVEFISKTITNGKLKNSSSKYLKTGTTGDLKCSQLNKDSLELASVIIKNPLTKHIEFINDSLNFENKKIQLQKASFSLRLQLHNQTVFVAIKEIKDSLSTGNTLLITKLD